MQNNLEILKYILDIFKKYKWRMILYFVFYIFLTNVIEIFLLPYLLKILGNSFQANTLTTNKALIIIFMYSILFCYKYISDMAFWKYLVYDFNFKAEMDFKLKLFSYTIKHSIDYYNNTMAGIISNRISNITNSIADQTIDEFFSIVSGLTIFIISVVVYSKVNIYLVIFLIIWSISFCAIQYIISKFIYKNVKDLTLKNNEISGQITDSFINISNVKSFSRQKSERLIVKKQGVEMLKYESNVMKAKTISNIAMFISLSILIIFMLGFSLKLVFQKEMLIGTFLFIGQNIILTTFMLRKIFRSSIDFIQHISEINEGLNMILQPIGIMDKENARKLKVDGGRIVFRGINFGYKKEENAK